jgi:hypothetical protein
MLTTDPLLTRPMLCWHDQFCAAAESHNRDVVMVVTVVCELDELVKQTNQPSKNFG